jgi:hypothetical protein
MQYLTQYPINLSRIDYSSFFPEKKIMGVPEISAGIDDLSHLVKKHIEQINIPSGLSVEALAEFENILDSFSIYPQYLGRPITEQVIRNRLICENRFGPVVPIPPGEAKDHYEYFGRKVRNGEPLVLGGRVYTCFNNYLKIDQASHGLILLPEKKKN